jgi:release factor glutamine methyltransferase
VSKGEPLAYVLGAREFFGLSFISSKHALIPRPETELLVEHVVNHFKNQDRVLIADLGTGSGCIAVSIAHALRQSAVFATDVSRDALQLAQLNAARHNVQNRVEFLEGQSGEWAEPLVRHGYTATLDCIVTNPPYISPVDVEQLPTQIKDHEPRLALDGGEDGLYCYRQIAAQCGVLLAPGGFLLAELGAGQFAQVSDVFNAAGWQVLSPIHDFAGHERVLHAQFG